MPNTAERSSTWREACLRASLRAYPQADRTRYGSELYAAATDLAASGSTWHEVAGLLRGGLAARARRWRSGILAFDRGAAAELLVVPIAACAVAIWGAAAIARMAGRTGAGAGVTAGAVVLLLTVALLVLATARRQRGLATAASLLLLLQATLAAGWSQWRGDTVTAAPNLHLHVGPWWFGPSLAWSLLPFLFLLVACCPAMQPAAPRVRGLRLPRRETGAARLAFLLAPSAVILAVLELSPGLVLEPNVSETTELPGLLFLMLMVAALWAATSTLHGRDHWSAAAALVGLAVVPSVGYGFAGLVTPQLATFGLGADPIRLAIVLGLAALIILLAVAIFLAALSRVGLRRLDAGVPMAD